MKYLFFAALILSIWSCDAKKSSLDSKDPQSDALVEVIAEKKGLGEPYMVNIQITSKDLKEGVGTEIYAGTMDSSNVHFDWQSPGQCLVTFQQQDNTERKILAVALEGKVGLKEIKGE